MKKIKQVGKSEEKTVIYKKALNLHRKTATRIICVVGNKIHIVARRKLHQA
jgi:hypothetical protein